MRMTLITVAIWYLFLSAILWAAASRFGLSDAMSLSGPGAAKKILFFSLYLIPLPYVLWRFRREK